VVSPKGATHLIELKESIEKPQVVITKPIVEVKP
jgi:hypothetical protein